MARVLVTGGAGFIGSHVVQQLLLAGHQPVVLDNLSSGRREIVPFAVPLYEVDVRDAGAVAEVFADVRPDWVCHQAAQISVSRSVREPALDAELNVLGLLHVLQAAVDQGVDRIVFASSGGVLYGDVWRPAAEDAPVAPQSPYGISKWAGERYLEFFARQHNLQAVALRYSNVYGPRQDPHGEAGVVAIFSQRMLAGQQVTINGDGRYVRDYVYVTDVARANLLALELDHTQPFVAINIGTGHGTDVNGLAAEVRSLCVERQYRGGMTLPIPVPSHGPARAGDLRSSLLDARRANALLGWSPRVSLVDGLRETVGWFAAETQRRRVA